MDATELNTSTRATRHNDLSAVLASLCKYFDEELERQQTILEVCRAQGLAARARDHAQLEDRALALTLLLQESVKAEQHRLALVHEVVGMLALPEERQTLSGLIGSVGQPWKLRMQEFQIQMRATLAATREVVRENNAILRRSLRIVNQALSSVSPAWAGGQQYTSAGLAAASSNAAAMGRINRQG